MKSSTLIPLGMVLCGAIAGLVRGADEFKDLKPLNEMTATDRYKGEDGGLYGGGQNEPPESHRKAAQAALQQIKPLDAQGNASPDGKVVLLGIGVSNTKQKFGGLKQKADQDQDKSPHLVLVNGGFAAGAGWWAKAAGPWDNLAAQLEAAHVTRNQVQVAWIMHVNPNPAKDAPPLEDAKKLKTDIAAVLARMGKQYPNLKMVYLSSRTFGGYGQAHPEPYAYETAFAVRWLIQDQIKDTTTGKNVSPILVWGPYLWANGLTPRKSDKLVWERKDFSKADGTHLDSSGINKVADLLLNFCKTDPGARTWFLKK